MIKKSYIICVRKSLKKSRNLKSLAREVNQAHKTFPGTTVMIIRNGIIYSEPVKNEQFTNLIWGGV